MLNFFKKKIEDKKNNSNRGFEIELTAVVLAYEIARADGNILESELNILMKEVTAISEKVNKTNDEIFKIIEEFSKNSISFYEFIEDINNEFLYDDKLQLLNFLWEVAYADSILEINEERLIRRIADLIKVKDIDVLKIKDKNKNT
ncbi:TerB family tellurite resistance protein [Gammaproteobacteria bacterium]|nr:TerB family tellurite resistance protein [Gammaproteobacteria bacterium]